VNSKCDIFGGNCEIKAQQLLELNYQHDHQHILYPGTGSEVKQQIQEILNQLQQAYQQTNKFELDHFLVLYTQNTTTIAVENSDSDFDLELNRFFKLLHPLL
ncbi:33086_t:CDS:2, partial [Gigaspora margarita]